MNAETKSFVINIILGIVAGFASWKIHVSSYSTTGSLQGFLVGIAFFALSSFIIKLTIGPKTLKWIMSNGGWYFFGFWFLVWTILFNIW